MRKLLLLTILMIGFTTFSFAQQRPTTELELPTAPFKIGFYNKTHKEIYVAVRYQDLNKNWVTKSWFKYGPYQSDKSDKTLVFKSYNRIFYYYATTKQGSDGKYTYWGGTDNYKTIDGVEYGMKEKIISKEKHPKAVGQQYIVTLIIE